MVLLWGNSLALLDIGQEEALGYSILEPKSCPSQLFELEPKRARDPALSTREGNVLAAEEQALTPGKKRKRQQHTRPLNEMEIQSQARQEAPQTAVEAGLQRLRDWLHESGHATIRAAAQAESNANTATCSLHLEPAEPQSTMFGSREALPSSHACTDLQPARPLHTPKADLCSMCQAAWDILKQDHLPAAAAPMRDSSISLQQPLPPHVPHGHSSDSSGCPNHEPATANAAHDQQHSNYHLPCAQTLAQHGNASIQGQRLQRQAPQQQAKPQSKLVFSQLDLPALHKVKHLIKPKLVSCSRHCLLQHVQATRGKVTAARSDLDSAIGKLFDRVWEPQVSPCSPQGSTSDLSVMTCEQPWFQVRTRPSSPCKQESCSGRTHVKTDRGQAGIASTLKVFARQECRQSY